MFIRSNNPSAQPIRPLFRSDDPASTLGQGDPQTKHKDLIFFGYSGVQGEGLRERDLSHLMVALTLREHIARRFPKDVIEIICAWHKNTFVTSLMTDQQFKIRQIHYVGHGSGGGLFFGYKNRIAMNARAALNDEFQTGSLSTRTDTDKRLIALERDAGLMTGFFTDVLSHTKLEKIKDQLGSDALMHIWGCFAGAPNHTFDRTSAYWNLFNASGIPADGTARHISKALGISVTAVWHPGGIRGTVFWHRDATGRFLSLQATRPARTPQWNWPLAKSVRWITYDRLGNGDERNINFLGKTLPASRLKPGRPPRWFTNEIPIRRAREKPAASPPCSPISVAF